MNQYPKNCILLAGRTGAGKTQLAKIIHEELGIPFVGFGDTVRAEARSRSLDSHDKKVLQELGQSMVEEHTLDFCRKVLEMAGEDLDWLTIEGLRHKKVLAALKSILQNSRIVVLHVHASREARFDRMRISRGWSESQCASYEGDATEIEVDTFLAEIADLSFDNSADLEALKSVVRSRLGDELGMGI